MDDISIYYCIEYLYTLDSDIIVRQKQDTIVQNAFQFERQPTGRPADLQILLSRFALFGSILFQ